MCTWFYILSTGLTFLLSNASPWHSTYFMALFLVLIERFFTIWLFEFAWIWKCLQWPKNAIFWLHFVLWKVSPHIFLLLYTGKRPSIYYIVKLDERLQNNQQWGVPFFFTHPCFRIFCNITHITYILRVLVFENFTTLPTLPTLPTFWGYQF